jgi:hypothetical protein
LAFSSFPDSLHGFSNLGLGGIAHDGLVASEDLFEQESV